uniref:ANK_REP_REGION domain-containing protein n=1 Tax=Gongylonema pulchrum TaxID=637853 RepID=A0A183DYT5_9BILA
LKIAEEANRRSMEDRIRSEKDKKINLYGETRMHEAARGNDSRYLKTLIEVGYNLNARDEGGWTPLHEAVGALKLENVRILAQSGANLNLRSNEGTLSAEGERTDSGGLTPLMEACDRGATAIVNLLLQYGANVALKNRDDWTALDFFRNAMKMGMIENEDLVEATRLVSLMEKKLKEAHITVNSEPPPKKLKVDDKPAAKLPRLENEASSQRRRVLDPNVANLHEYQKMMNAVGRGAVAHDRKNALLGDGDDELFDEDEEDGLRHLEPPLDDLLIGVDNLLEVAPSSPSATTSAPAPSAPTGKSRKAVKNSEFVWDVDDLYTELHDDFPCTSASAESSHSQRPKSGVRARPTARIISDNSDSENETAVVPPQAATHQRSTGSERQLQLADCARSAPKCSSNRDVREAEKTLPPAWRSNGTVQPTENKTVSAAAAASSTKQIFIKLVIKQDDGTHFKTKGMPFSSSSTIGDVRKRCDVELRGEVEYSSMVISHDDCELTDDTPLELVLADGNKLLECILIGCRSLRQLIGDYSLCSMLKKLDLSFNDFNDDGSDFVEMFASLCPNLVHLKLASCNMSSTTVDGLVRQLTSNISYFFTVNRG